LLNEISIFEITKVIKIAIKLAEYVVAVLSTIIARGIKINMPIAV
jgi:hypothetical protein